MERPENPFGVKRYSEPTKFFNSNSRKIDISEENELAPEIKDHGGSNLEYVFP